MGIVANVKTGLALSLDSLTVLREHPRLLVFPAMSAIATMCFLVFLYAGVFVASFLGSGAEYVALFVLYFVSTFVASLFTAALVYSVNDAFHGEEPSIKRGLAAAWEMKGTLAVWSAIAAVVSIVIRQLEQSDNPAAQLLKSLFALGWTITTFFIIPVIVFEDVNAKTMFTRSASTFKDTWGETLGAGLGLGIIQFLLVVAALVVAGGLGLVISVISPIAGIGVGIFVAAAGVILAVLVGQTIRGIAKTALYVYAQEGVVPSEFDDFDFQTLGGRAEPGAGSKAEPVEGRI